MAVNGRLRVTTLGDENAVLEVGPEDLDADDRNPRAATSGKTIVALPLDPDPDERAAGQVRFEVLVDGWRFEVRVEPADRAALRDRARRVAGADRVQDRLAIRAQIPGRVVRVWVTPGQAIEHGQRLLAIEAMKMENEVRAPRSGTVEAVHVELGGAVELRDELVTLA